MESEAQNRFSQFFPSINKWDEETFRSIYFTFTSSRVKKISKIISFTADPRLWGLWITIFGIIGLITLDFTNAVVFFFGFMQCFITYQILKKYFKRPRPFVHFDDVNRHDKTGHGYSFPSGHVHHSAIFVILLGLTFVPKWWFIFPLFIYHFLVALSRLINGCHYPFDTIFAVIESYCEVAFYWFVTKFLYIELFQYLWNFLGIA